MSDLSFIPDGYTFDGYVAPVAGLHAGLTWKYRPLTTDDVDEMVEARKDKKPTAANEHTRTVLAGRISAWDLKGPDRAAVPVSVAGLKGMHRLLFYRVQSVMMGTDISNARPGTEAAEQETLADEAKN